MGSPGLTALLLPLVQLLLGLSASASIGCPYLPSWSTLCLLASHMDDSFTGRSAQIPRHTLSAFPPSPKPWRAWLCHCPCCWCLHLVSDPSGLQWDWLHLLVQKSKKSYKFRFCRRHTMPASAQTPPTRGCVPKEPNLQIQRKGKFSPNVAHKGLEVGTSCDWRWWSQVVVPVLRRKDKATKSPFSPGPEFSFDLLPEARVIQVTIPPGPEVSVRLCHQWALECEELSRPFDAQVSYLQEDTVRHKKCPFQSWPEALVCLGEGGLAPSALLQAPSWNVSMDTQAQQLVLHFSSRMPATFSAAWSHSGLGQDSMVPPVYNVSQTQGSSSVTLDLIVPFLRPGGCVLVWRSDVQFAWKHLLCPDVSHRLLGLLILVLLAFTTLLGVVLVLTCQRPLSGPGRARPVLLLHVADSEAQRRLVGALAELLRAALGGGRDVIVDLWEGTRVARVGPLPWLWAARARVARERGTVLLLWSCASPSPAGGPDARAAPLHTLLRAAPRPLPLLAYFSRLCAKGDIPPPLRALPRYRLLQDLPRLLRALDARTSTQATSWGRLAARPCLRSRVELCRQLEREAAKLADQG
ncbi:interleukin-17 receptor E isoform X14 [Orcinus orca]|uniref:interleukin-17 receptor E isoform X14 n=1 Tax=Orcinus orca TaxID=9733 RepID=UPI00144210AC|nr:interleukin-17 receptor E isoform X14 [Orcinus orca]